MIVGYLIGAILLGGLTVQSWGGQLLQTAPPEVTQFNQLTEPSDIQPALGVNALQNTVSPQQTVNPQVTVQSIQRTKNPQ